MCAVHPGLDIVGHKVIIAPYKASCYMSTQQLGVQMMRQMRCPENVDEEVYIRHCDFCKFYPSCQVYD